MELSLIECHSYNYLNAQIKKSASTYVTGSEIATVFTKFFKTELLLPLCRAGLRPDSQVISALLQPCQARLLFTIHIYTVLQKLFSYTGPPPEVDLNPDLGPHSTGGLSYLFLLR